MTTFEELSQTVLRGENTRVEFKSGISVEVLRGLSTDIAALANSQGGVIIFGVAKQKELVGCQWDDKDTERISQESSNCRPSINIDFEEVTSDEKRYLLVHVPKSRIIHNDVHYRFPCRIGNTTDYLDALGLVSLLQERGLTQGEVVQQFQPTSARAREPLPRAQEDLLVQALSNKDPAVRFEALRDLAYLPHYYILLEHERMVKSIRSILVSKDPEEIRLILQALRIVASRGTSQEKDKLQPLMGLNLNIGKSFSIIDIARQAYDVLLYSKNSGALDLVVFWVTAADDQTFATIKPETNMLMEAGVFGLKEPLRQKMYGQLMDNPSENVRTRASAILQSLRQVYP